MPLIRSVLCVDDEPLILGLLDAVLTTRGHRFLGASSGREALLVAAQQHVDAVILDYSMPDMNGEAVAEELKTLSPNTPIIMFSGSMDISSKALSTVDGFVAKGEGVQALLASLQRLLQPCGTHKLVRRFPRFPARLPMAITVDRAGELAMLQGTSIDVGEGGIGGMVMGDLEPGEVVLLTIADSRLATRLEPRAQVRYRKDDNYGFAFLAATASEQDAVRQFCRRLASG